MMIRVTHEFDLSNETVGAAKLEDAAWALASVMGVQAEDGLYTLGWPENDEPENEFLADLALVKTTVELV